MKKKIRQTTGFSGIQQGYAGVVVMMVLVVVLSISAYRNNLQQEEAIQSNLHTYQVLENINGVLMSLLNMETGIRGFALSGDEYFLEPYERGSKAFEDYFSQVAALTQDNPAQQRRLSVLRSYKERWDAYSVDLEKVRRTVNRDERSQQDVEQLVSSRQGKLLMDDMRAVITDFTAMEKELQAQRIAVMQRSGQQARFLSVGLTIVVLILAGFFISVVAYTIRKRQAAERLLQQMNQELEGKVRERTSELQELNATLEEEAMERQAAQDSLVQLNAKLEATVEERTHELQELNAALEEEVTERQAAQEALLELNAGLEWKVQERTSELQEMNATLEEEVMERQAAQELMQEGKERYEALLRQSVEAIVVLDLDLQKVVDINEAFRRMFECTITSADTTSIIEMGLLTPAELKAIRWQAGEGLILETTTRHYLTGAERIIQAERTGSFIRHRGRQLLMLSYHDVTQERKLQATVQEQVILAADVQKSMLPVDETAGGMIMRTIFEPVTLVSGDFYGWQWSPDKQRLNGYVIDVTGHGVPAALYTSAVNGLLHEAVRDGNAWNIDKVNWLNEQLNAYLNDNTFVALFAYTFDFARRELTCVAGGINYFLVSSADYSGVVSLPGIYLGVAQEPRFGVMTLPFQHGDSFYFMTDGIYERLPSTILHEVGAFEATVSSLRQVAGGRTNDDCSAVCVHISGLKPMPTRIRFSKGQNKLAIRQRLSRTLRVLAGEQQPRVEVALGEALANALRYSPNVQVKLNKIGPNLVLRVRNEGEGFDGNRMVRQYRECDLTQLFLSRLEQERGRGILIMMMWMDQVMYNRQGNEVMMIKTLAED